MAGKADAQVSVHVGFNIPARRVYVPAPRPVVVEEQPVYDDDAQVNYNYDGDDYYYLPEVEAYYAPAAHCYYYNDGNNWVTRAYLPGAYRNYNWRTSVRYEVRGYRPYLRHDVYRGRWGGYNGDRGNWGHRFERRYDGGYAHQNRDNRGWDRGNRNNDRGNWGGRPNDGRDRGNWGGRPNQGNGHNQGNWGGRDHGNRGDGQRFADNRGGFGVRH